jgi:tetratricopeptide (TPR) repeat protein
MSGDPCRVRDLLRGAMELPAPDRSNFLTSQCGADADLRAAVEQLLAAADTPDLAGSLTSGASDTDPQSELQTRTYASADETPTFGIVSPSSAATGLAPGEVIAGRYTLVEVIGEGGMGSVYLAEQTAPVKRQVALKLIKAGTDSVQVLARFDAERQALAVMDHPNIARVYDGGTTSSGQPFFVMELVKGEPLTGYCDRQRLPVRARLELFVAVCQAVQHAHQKGIIHRDLKPGNVLVTEVDGRPTPKVIDFGVAKATELKLTEMSFADAGAIVGTPAYMSPEQADPTTTDIDTRTDVYALGIILYELLVGSPPLDGRRLKRGSLLELLRMVREVEPPRPSTKLSTADDLRNIAANRSIEPSKLARSLHAELDWVVMKALTKDRTRRYDTAIGLARDVQRYLADEVVEARPPSVGYRVRKFVRRHKGRVIAASLVILALLGGIVGTTLGLIAARRAAEEERLAKQEAEANFRAARAAEAKEAEQRRDAEKARDAEKTAREVRDTQQLLTLDTLRGQSVMVDNALKAKQSLQGLRLQIQQITLRDLEKLRKHMEEHPLVSRAEAAALQRMGSIYLASNRVQEARAQYQKSAAVTEQWVKENPSEAVGPRNLAAIKNGLADVELRLGDAEAARRLYTEALDLRQQWLKMLAGTPGEAVARQAIAESHNLLGRASLELGEPARALESFRAADAGYGSLPQQVAAGLQVRRDRSYVRDGIAESLYRVGETKRAEEQHLAVFKERETLAQAHPTIDVLKKDLAFSHLVLGDFYLFERRDAGRALGRYQVLFAIATAEFKADPDDMAARRELAVLQYRLGYAVGMLADASPLTEAAMLLRALSQVHYRNCLAIRQELAGVDAKDTRGQIDLLVIQARVGRTADAEKTARALLVQAGKDRRVLFQAACGLAIAGSGTGPDAERCRAEALRALGSLIDQGWKDRVTLLRDPDLEGVRGDPRFAALVARIPN